MEARQQKFLQNYTDEKISRISQDIYIYSPVNNAKEMQMPDWELRFAILPEKENMNKAAEVIAKTLLDEKTIPHDISFKLASFNKVKDGKPLDSWYALGAEGPYTRMENNSDRDQRGKEFCLYLRFNKETEKAEFTPEEWKTIILKLWKALHDAKVVMGYINPQIGDVMLPSETITPVSYAHTLDRDWQSLTTDFWQKVHEDKEKNTPYLTEKLYQDDWEKYKNKKTNPLAGINITFADLEKAGISYESIFEMQNSKVSYLEQHIKDTKFIARELKNLTCEKKWNNFSERKKFIHDEITLLENVVTLLPLDGTSKESLQTIENSIQNIARLLPRQDKYGILHLPTPVAELQYIFADFEKKKNQSGYMTGFLQRIKALEEYIQCEYTEDQLNVQYQRIADLYAQDAWIMSLLQIYKIDPHTFKNSIANAPAEMELTYRHLREIKKEAIMFREAYEQFQKMPTVEDMQAFRKKLALSIELVNDIIHSLGFFNRLCGKMQYWIALKDSITHCKTIDVLNELLQGMKDKSKHQALIDSPKYEELQIRTEHCHCHECKSFSF